MLYGWLSGILKLDIPQKIENPTHTIKFSPYVLEELNKYYATGIEHGVCLDAYITDYHNYYILQIGQVFVGDEDSIDSHPACNTMVYYHNHPDGNNPFAFSCYASKGDIDSFKLYAKNGVTIFIIQCDYNKFIYYTIDNLYEGIEYEQEI